MGCMCMNDKNTPQKQKNGQTQTKQIDIDTVKNTPGELKVLKQKLTKMTRINDECQKIKEQIGEREIQPSSIGQCPSKAQYPIIFDGNVNNPGNQKDIKRQSSQRMPSQQTFNSRRLWNKVLELAKNKSQSYRDENQDQEQNDQITIKINPQQKNIQQIDNFQKFSTHKLISKIPSVNELPYGGKNLQQTPKKFTQSTIIQTQSDIFTNPYFNQLQVNVNFSSIKPKNKTSEYSCRQGSLQIRQTDEIQIDEGPPAADPKQTDSSNLLLTTYKPKIKFTESVLHVFNQKKT